MSRPWILDSIFYLIILYSIIYLTYNIKIIYKKTNVYDPFTNTQLENNISSDMAATRQQFEYVYKIQNQEQWEEELKKPGIVVLDVYSAWAGPCNAITSTFKRLKIELNNDINFYQVLADEIEDLKEYRDNACPNFLFYNNGVFVDLVQGVNASLIEKKIHIQIENEKNNVPRVVFVPQKKDKPKTPLKFKQEVKVDKDYVIAILKPEVMRNDIIEKIIELFMKNGFAIEEKKDIELTVEQVSVLYEDMQDDDPTKQKLIEYMSSNPCLAFLLAREDPFNLLTELIGPSDPAVAKEESPESIRSIYGVDEIKNAIYGSKNSASVLKEAEILFPDRLDEIKEQQGKLKLIATSVQRTLAIIKPDAYKEGKKDEILNIITSHDFTIVSEKEILMTKDIAQEFYRDHISKSFFDTLTKYMSSGPIYAVVLERANAIKVLREIIGPTNPEKAKEVAPESIRTLYGIDICKNAIHASESLSCAEKEINILFPEIEELKDDIKPMNERTLSFIKPDAYAEGKKDEILGIIKEKGYNIIAESEMKLELDIAKELYKSQENESFYDEITKWISSEPIYAMILEKVNAIKDFRVLLGPTDSDEAKSTQPESLRALFGTSILKNAVHGAGSESEAINEIKLLFPDVDPIASQTDQVEKVLFLIKPDVYANNKKDEIVNILKENNFTILAEKETKMNEETSAVIFKRHYGKSFYNELIEWVSNKPVYAMIVERVDGISRLARIKGPTDPSRAVVTAPNSLRAKYGVDGIRNVVHTSVSTEAAEEEIKLIFTDINVKEEKESTLALIKPDAYKNGKKDEIVNIIKEKGFNIVAEKEYTMTMDIAKEFYKEHVGKPFFDELTTWMSSEPIYAMKLEKENAVKAWRELMGPTNSEKAREEAPESIRARFGTDGSQNAVHGSDSDASATRELGLIFPELASVAKAPESSSEKKECTLGLIKPDAYKNGKKDEIVSIIKEKGFNIVAEKEYTMTIDVAKEFYKEHVGKPFFDELTTWMSSEPIYAMKLEKENAVKAWRELMGPTNSEKAREEAPESIRARFGTDGSQNAVHGSDSDASAARELGLIFSELTKSESVEKSVDEDKSKTVITEKSSEDTKLETKSEEKSTEEIKSEALQEEKTSEKEKSENTSNEEKPVDEPKPGVISEEKPVEDSKAEIKPEEELKNAEESKSEVISEEKQVKDVKTEEAISEEKSKEKVEPVEEVKKEETVSEEKPEEKVEPVKEVKKEETVSEEKPEEKVEPVKEVKKEEAVSEEKPEEKVEPVEEIKKEEVVSEEKPEEKVEPIEEVKKEEAVSEEKPEEKVEPVEEVKKEEVVSEEKPDEKVEPVEEVKKEEAVSEEKPEEKVEPVEEVKKEEVVSEEKPEEKVEPVEEVKKEETVSEEKPEEKVEPVEEVKKEEVASEEKPVEEAKIEETVSEEKPEEKVEPVEEVKKEEVVSEEKPEEKIDHVEEVKKEEAVSEEKPEEKVEPVEEVKKEEVASEEKPVEEAKIEETVSEEKPEEKVEPVEEVKKEEVVSEEKPEEKVEPVEEIKANENESKEKPEEGKTDEVVSEEQPVEEVKTEKVEPEGEAKQVEESKPEVISDEKLEEVKNENINNEEVKKNEVASEENTTEENKQEVATEQEAATE